MHATTTTATATATAAAAAADAPEVRRHRASCPRPKGRRRRRLGAAALAVGGLSLVGTAAFASWQVTTSQDSGQLSAADAAATLLDANGGSFTTGVANLVPADYFYRYVDVRNDGTLPGTYTGTVGADGALAGHLLVEAASRALPWTTVGGTSTCLSATPLGSGTPTTGAPVTVSHGQIGVGPLAAQHVRYKFTFSPTAPDTLRGQTGKISVTVSNTLVGGANRTNG